MMVLYFVFGVKIAFYGKIYIRKSLITRDVIKKIKRYSVR